MPRKEKEKRREMEAAGEERGGKGGENGGLKVASWIWAIQLDRHDMTLALGPAQCVLR